MPLADLLRKHGIIRPIHSAWKSTYGGTSALKLRGLNDLEQKSAMLKQCYAQLALENAAIKDGLNRRT